jgi:hypothetical protein
MPWVNALGPHNFGANSCKKLNKYDQILKNLLQECIDDLSARPKYVQIFQNTRANNTTAVCRNIKAHFEQYYWYVLLRSLDDNILSVM